MKEYIERESLHDEIRSLSVSITGLRCGKGVLNEYMKQYRESVLRIVDEQPTADVQEVRHGKWIYCGKQRGYDHKWQCSECLRLEFTKHKADIKDYPYCHCGARMDGER